VKRIVICAVGTRNELERKDAGVRVGRQTGPRNGSHGSSIRRTELRLLRDSFFFNRTAIRDDFAPLENAISWFAGRQEASRTRPT